MTHHKVLEEANCLIIGIVGMYFRLLIFTGRTFFVMDFFFVTQISLA